MKLSKEGFTGNKRPKGYTSKRTFEHNMFDMKVLQFYVEIPNKLIHMYIA